MQQQTKEVEAEVATAITTNPPLSPPLSAFGFIVLRHINSEQTSRYWVECCSRIRRFYPEVPIVIIDDGSDSKYHDPAQEAALYKCTIVRTIFQKRGELLPYYYYLLHNDWFDAALVIHDSVFINSYIDFESHIQNTLSTTGCTFLWHFTYLYDNKFNEASIIAKLQNSIDLMRVYNNRDSWSGCFGVMSLIRRDFLLEMDRTYALSGLLGHVTSRAARMALERAFACMVFDLQNMKNIIINPHNISLLGCIHDYCKWGYSYSDYLQNINNYGSVLPVIKVWSGR
jgi:hypothetical protein